MDCLLLLGWILQITNNTACLVLFDHVYLVQYILGGFVHPKSLLRLANLLMRLQIHRFVMLSHLLRGLRLLLLHFGCLWWRRSWLLGMVSCLLWLHDLDIWYRGIGACRVLLLDCILLLLLIEEGLCLREDVLLV